MTTPSTINWRTWDAQLFSQARAAGKTIFLSISASWCHWCHVMDEESFNHPEVIRQLNDRFIPVRVDSDKRPDINSRYNMGGWPTVALLDERGEVLTGGTYLPTGQLLQMLSATRTVCPTAVSRPAPVCQSGTVPALDQSLADQVAAAVARAYDPHFGGFGLAPKFPQPWAIELAWHRAARTDDPQWTRMATHTLDAMRDSELYDVADGGFFRYATSADWDAPHYEKLLDANAHLLTLYLRAYRLTGDPRYRATAQGVLDYFRHELAVDGESGGEAWFCGSQSADRDYYRLSQEERLDTASPSRDHTLYTDRNAAAASALLLCGRLLGQPEAWQTGANLLDLLWSRCRRSGQGLYHVANGASAVYGYLSDQVAVLGTLLDGIEQTPRRDWRAHALELAAVMDAELWDDKEGGYWDLPANTGGDGLLRVRLKPFAENAMAVDALLRLAFLTGDEHYRQRAEQGLGWLATVYPAYRHYAAPFGVVLDRWLHPPDLVVVAGHPDDPCWVSLLDAAHRLPSTWLIVCPLDVAQDQEHRRMRGLPASARPAAYLCRGAHCLAPAADPGELRHRFAER